MDWIDVAQDRNRWQALVNAVIKLWFQRLSTFGLEMVYHTRKSLFMSLFKVGFALRQ